jgi:hypothetical protein
MASNIISGARCILKIAGKKVALATGVSINEGIDYEPFRPLDTLEVVEFVEVAYNCSMSADMVAAVTQDPTQQGLFPRIDLLSILTQVEMTAEIYDALTGQLVLVAEGVKPSTNNRNFRAGQIVANDISFVVKRVKSSVEANGGTTPASGSPTGIV